LRRLLLVPIVHEPADMGSGALDLLRQTVRLAGERRWTAHQRVIARYWERVGEHLRTLDAGRLRIYQDGLPVGGEAGRRIVAEAAARGSRNHGLLLALVERGAELRETEEVALLVRERARAARGGEDPEDARGDGDALLVERDRAMARRIDASLRPGEIGVLFVGASHQVERWLPADVAIEPVKDPRRVLAYFQALFLPREDAVLRQLGEYLAAPV
jgi:hypothetical protein